jgi:hypothetical protein
MIRKALSTQQFFHGELAPIRFAPPFRPRLARIRLPSRGDSHSLSELLDKLDEIERAWIGRMIRLANLLGVDRDHKEYLDFLKDWASHEHH